MSTAAAVVLAGGSGSRFGASTNKVLQRLGPTSVLGASVRTALSVSAVGYWVVVHHPDEQPQIAELLAPEIGDREIRLVAGGTERHHSEFNALQALASEIDQGLIDVVAIHDAARPLATEQLWDRVITAARRHGAAIPTAPAGPLLRSSAQAGDDPAPAEGPVLRDLVAVQTPQAFSAPTILKAHRLARQTGTTATDTAACLEMTGESHLIVAVENSELNLKITWPSDLATAERLWQRYSVAEHA